MMFFVSSGLVLPFASDFDAALALERGEALDPLDLVLAHQELDALGVLVDDAVLALDHLRDN